MKFAPVVYEHAARFIKKTPWEVSRREQLMALAHEKAYRSYGHSPIVVGIDIYNLEAEALGAIVEQPEGYGIPAIRQHLFSAAKEVLDLPLFDPEADGRIKDIVNAAATIKRKFPEADVRVPVSGPFSILSQLLGLENLLMESLMYPDNVAAALNHLIEGQSRFIQFVIKKGLGISFFESSATPPLISPQIFSDLVLPALKKMVDMAQKITGKPVACIMGGDTAPIIDLIMSLKFGFVICPHETNQELFMERMEKYPDTLVRINMNPNVFTLKDEKKIFKEVNRVLALARKRANVVIGSGILPYDADPEMVIKIKNYLESFN